MNMIKTTLIAAAVLAAGAAVAGPFYGKGMDGCEGGYSQHAFKRGGGPMMMDSERMVSRMSSRLNLTEEQQTAVKAIFGNYQPQLQEAAKAMREGQESLFELNQGNPLNDAELEQLATAQGDHLTQMILLKNKLHKELDAILTAEQREEMGNMWKRKRPF